jgi:ribonuclease HII
VAAAVLLPNDLASLPVSKKGESGSSYPFWIHQVQDSKKVKAPLREKLADFIRECALGYAVAQCKPKVIDAVNIRQASLLAMTAAVLALTRGFPACVNQSVLEKAQILECKVWDSDSHPTRGFPRVLVDGRDTLPLLVSLGVQVVPVIAGDSTWLSIAAASILAKVVRDGLMVQASHDYPGYGFAEHKGYPTRQHYAALAKLGMTQIHRKTFLGFSKVPVSDFGMTLATD